MQVAVANDWIDRFREILGENAVFNDEDVLQAHATDETHDQYHRPDLVLKPESVEDVSRIAKLCNETGIPIVARGGGSGVSGGALATRGGVVLCLERLNRILEIDPRNQTVTVETGAITGEVQQELLKRGLWLPPDPGSKSWCQIGGNLAEAAAGPKSLKYGAFRDYVLNLEVVLASGEVIWTGANVRKFASGYNLTQLMLGSEGTLGIITKAVFRLIPPPKHSLLLRVALPDLTSACELMCRTFESGLHPCEMEFMEPDGIALTRAFSNEAISTETACLVWIGFDGEVEEALLEHAEKVAELAEALKALEVLVAETEQQQKDLWDFRHRVGPAVIETTPFRDVDLTFPRSRLLEIIEGIKTIGGQEGFRTVVFGHAGDGNLHVNVLRDQMDDATWQRTIDVGITELYKLACDLGGTLSGEHGIGTALRHQMPLAFQPSNLTLMRGIKAAFDPRGILNPGKILPD